MDKRSQLALLLITGIWIAWFLFMGTQQPPVVPETPGQQVEQARENVTESETTKTVPAVQVQQTGSYTKPKQEETYVKSTDKFDITFTNRGAAVAGLFYRERGIELTVNEPYYDSSGVLDFALHFSEKEFFDGGSLDSVLWQGVETDTGIRFTTQAMVNNAPIKIIKEYVLDKETRSMEVFYSFSNEGKNDVTMNNGKVIISPGDLVGPQLDYSNTYNMPKSVFENNGDYTEQTKGSGFFSKAGPMKREAGTINWFGLMSRYTTILMVPREVKGDEVLFDNREGKSFRIGAVIPVETLSPGSSITRSFKVYMGEKNKELLSEIDPSLKKAAHINMLIEPINNFVIWVLKKFYALFGNYGWALVVFSILTKIVFLPLTKKSTDSMRRMQQLTPELNKLKAKYKDKPDVMQKKMMEMYKENKVNPMGGCFPLLLQMPFFIALYTALINSIELWQAEFIFWIQDLSMPDTVFAIDGFNINILPIIMTVSTFLQQKIMTVDTGAGQQQKMLMYMMPLIFIFIFWTMPSGLVLYWTLQNVFQVVHQLIANKFSSGGKK